LPNLDLTRTSYDHFVLFVGRLEICKGIVEFSQKFNHGGSGQQSLIVVGTGPMDRVMREISRRPNSRISVLGRVTDERLRELYSSCRAVVFPSIWPEVMPAVPLEAMSYGKPVVATAIGGTVDFVRNEENGFLAPPGDIEALVRHCNTLLEDEILASEMGSLGRRTVNELSVENHSRKLLELYASVISG